MTLSIAYSANNSWIIAKDIVTIVGTVGALIIGACGLSTWRRQLQGTWEYDVAKRVILHTYQVRDAMQAVRSPLLSRRKEEVEAGRSLEEEQRIYGERIRYLQERWAELQTLSLEARVLWGPEAETRIDPLRRLIATLHTEIGRHFWLQGAHALPGAFVDKNQQTVDSNEKIIYRSSVDDEFSKSVDAAVLQVEDFFCPRLRTRGITSASTFLRLIPGKK